MKISCLFRENLSNRVPAENAKNRDFIGDQNNSLENPGTGIFSGVFADNDLIIKAFNDFVHICF